MDTDGTESVDSESVSLVLSAPATSLSGTASKSGGGGAVCFVSNVQKAFSWDIMRGVAIFGVFVILGLLIQGRKAPRLNPPEADKYAPPVVNSVSSPPTSYPFSPYALSREP